MSTVRPQEAPTLRRNQQQRSATSRRAILDAAIACIDQEGFARATTSRIARRAGLTVGAVQHHFPAKALLLAAILEESSRRFAACFDDLALPADAGVDRRAEVFARRAWRHYGSPFFRAPNEILLYSRRPAATGPQPMAEGWAREALETSNRRAVGIWQRVFGALALPPTAERELLRFSFAVLTGIALMKRLDPGNASMNAQVDMFQRSLAERLRAALSAGGPARPSPGS